MLTLQSRLLCQILAFGCVVAVPLDLVMGQPAVLARPQESVELRGQPARNAVAVTISGLGKGARIEEQALKGSRWQAIIDAPDALELQKGSQQLTLPEAGLRAALLRGKGSRLVLQIASSGDELLAVPQIVQNGEDMIIRFEGFSGATAPTKQSSMLDLRTPARVEQSQERPPLRPRAVAPPVGDIAVGSMYITKRSFVNASGPPVTLFLKGSSALDALQAMARLGGYGFVFVDANGTSTNSAGGERFRPITVSFRAEPYDRALNSLLMASGLQGKMDGRTLLVGPSVSSIGLGPQLSKVFRLNQADVGSASRYLGNLGAVISVTNVTSMGSGSGESGGGSSAGGSTSANSVEASAYTSGVGPLEGLFGTTDTRLNTITLIGDPRLISIAEGYLKQIDLRRRQVAVKVQILSVSLNNIKTIDSSFSARIGKEAFFVSQSGKAHMNFGSYKPGNPSGTGVAQADGYREPGSYASSIPAVQRQREVPAMVPQRIFVPGVDGEEGSFQDVLDVNGQTVYVPSTDPAAAATFVPVFDSEGRPVYTQGRDPAKESHPSDSFYSYIEAMVTSTSTKTLAQPTLLVQEEEEATVETGESVITGVSKSVLDNGSSEFSNQRENAGLTLGLQVHRIDDNGFVTMTLNPTISVPQPAGTQEGVPIFNISARKLESGRIRLRDGQSLILTGVISESDRQQVQKWPLLGDLPLIGQLFRQSGSTREKNELVVIVTPTVLDDREGGSFDYGYKPGTQQTKDLLTDR